MVCLRRGIEVVITSLTRNQVAFTGTGVRIPLSPPHNTTLAENDRDENDRFLKIAVQQMGTTMIELWKAMDDPSIRKLLEDMIFNMTYRSAKERKGYLWHN